jgi:hypothetical protein
VGEVGEVVHPASAAFVERLQSSLSFARKCLIAAQQRQKALVDKRPVDQDYKVGDKVLLSTKYLNLKHSESSRKLLPKWIGPFEVVQVVGPVAYKLKMTSEVPFPAEGTPRIAVRLCMVAARRPRRQPAATVVLVTYCRRGGHGGQPPWTARLHVCRSRHLVGPL